MSKWIPPFYHEPYPCETPKHIKEAERGTLKYRYIHSLLENGKTAFVYLYSHLTYKCFICCLILKLNSCHQHQVFIWLLLLELQIPALRSQESFFLPVVSSSYYAELSWALCVRTWFLNDCFQVRKAEHSRLYKPFYLSNCFQCLGEPFWNFISSPYVCNVWPLSLCLEKRKQTSSWDTMVQMHFFQSLLALGWTSVKSSVHALK